MRAEIISAISRVKARRAVVIVALLGADVATARGKSWPLSFIGDYIAWFQFFLLCRFVRAGTNGWLWRLLVTYVTLAALILFLCLDYETAYSRAAKWVLLDWGGFLVGDSVGGSLILQMPGLLVGSLILIYAWSKRASESDTPDAEKAHCARAVAARQMSLLELLAYIAWLSLMFLCIKRWTPYPSWPLDVIEHVWEILWTLPAAKGAPVAKGTIVLLWGIVPAIWTTASYFGSRLAVKTGHVRREAAISLLVASLLGMISELSMLLIEPSDIYEFMWGGAFYEGICIAVYMAVFALAVFLLEHETATGQPSGTQVAEFRRGSG